MNRDELADLSRRLTRDAKRNLEAVRDGDLKRALGAAADLDLDALAIAELVAHP